MITWKHIEKVLTDIEKEGWRIERAKIFVNRKVFSTIKLDDTPKSIKHMDISICSGNKKDNEITFIFKKFNRSRMTLEGTEEDCFTVEIEE